MNGNQSSARCQRSCQWRQYPLGFELDRGTGAVRLGGDDEVVIGLRRAASRPHWVEQEFVIVAINDQNNRPFINRIAALRTDARPPMLRQEGLQRGDLLFELVCG